MGATYCRNWRNAQDVRNAIDSYLSRPDLVKERHIHGAEYWLLIGEPEHPEQERIIVYVIETDGGWGYRSFSVREWPYYYGCPQEWLNRTSDYGRDFEQWKAMVIQANAAA